MPAISIDEAKLLADVLQSTFLKTTSPSPKRGQWLNHIARAAGYRDWNAMAAVAPRQAPDMAFGVWGDAFYGLAWVEYPERPGVLCMLTTRDWKVAHPRTGWPGDLANMVRRHLPLDLRGMAFDYRRPGPAGQEARPWWEPAGDGGPILLSAAGGKARILLWWLKDRYTVGQNRTTPFIPMNHLGTDFSAYGQEPRADQFLRRLTGVARERRTCLYRTAMPNAADDMYLPVLVTEEESTGSLAPGWRPGDWETVGKQVCDANAAAGLSRYDAAAIAERYASFDPQPEEEELEFDFYGMSED